MTPPRPGPHEVICPHCYASIQCASGEDASRAFQQHWLYDCPKNERSTVQKTLRVVQAMRPRLRLVKG